MEIRLRAGVREMKQPGVDRQGRIARPPACCSPLIYCPRSNGPLSIVTPITWLDRSRNIARISIGWSGFHCIIKSLLVRYILNILRYISYDMFYPIKSSQQIVYVYTCTNRQFEESVNIIRLRYLMLMLLQHGFSYFQTQPGFISVIIISQC